MKHVKRTIDINEVKVEVVAGTNLESLIFYVENNMNSEQIDEVLDTLRASKKALIKSPFDKNKYFLNINKGKTTYLLVSDNVLNELDKNEDVRSSLDDNRNEVRMRDKICLIIRGIYADLA